MGTHLSLLSAEMVPGIVPFRPAFSMSSDASALGDKSLMPDGSSFPSGLLFRLSDRRELKMVSEEIVSDWNRLFDRLIDLQVHTDTETHWHMPYQSHWQYPGRRWTNQCDHNLNSPRP